MNEELQSMNDELQFSNDALREHQAEVDRLNHFMASVLGSMNSGSPSSTATCGCSPGTPGPRTSGASGRTRRSASTCEPRHRSALEQLLAPLRSSLVDPDLAPDVVRVPAVNRRGRSMEVAVTVTPIRDHLANAAAMLVMDVIEVADAQAE